MSDNNITVTAQNEVLPANGITVCKTCGAAWEPWNEICQWCNADISGVQKLPFNFRFPKVEPIESQWNKKRAVPIGKTILILIASIITGGILFYLLPLILAFSMFLRYVILVMCVYSIASVGLSFGISMIFKQLINVWGKGNSTWLITITSLIIFAPSALYNTIMYWAAGGVSGIMALIFGLVLPILGIAGIGIFNSTIGSGKFCPYCDANVYQRKDVLKVHSCNTNELLERIASNWPKDSLLDLDTPKMSKHAYTSAELFLCKKPDCRHAQIYIHQHMMNLTYDKSNKQWKENDVAQLIAEYEVTGSIYDSWIKGWDKKDSLA